MCPVPTNQPTTTIFQQVLDKSFEEGAGVPFCNLYINAVWISCSPVRGLSTGLLLGHPWSGGKASFACGRAEGAAGRLSQPRGLSTHARAGSMCTAGHNITWSWQTSFLLVSFQVGPLFSALPSQNRKSHLLSLFALLPCLGILGTGDYSKL